MQCVGMVADAKAVRLFLLTATAPGLHDFLSSIVGTMDASAVILRSIDLGSRPEVLHENPPNQGVSGHRVHGGVRPAAKKLCLTPSTVAKSIGQLESDLGAPLFERSALGLRLNAAGRSLLPYAETIVANADRAAAAVAAAATGRLTTLNISVTPTLPPEVLVEAMANFRSRWPAVKLVFTSGFFSDCVPKLLADKLDISLVMTSPLSARGALRARRGAAL